MLEPGESADPEDLAASTHVVVGEQVGLLLFRRERLHLDLAGGVALLLASERRDDARRDRGDDLQEGTTATRSVQR